MKKRAVHALRWTAVAIAAAALIGCGGNDTGTTAVADLAKMQNTTSGVRVTVADEAQTSGAKKEWIALQYAFSAKITTGPDAGSTYAGSMVLWGKREDDSSMEVKGVISPDAAARVLSITYRGDVGVLTERLNADLAAGDRHEALKRFEDAFDSRTAKQIAEAEAATKEDDHDHDEHASTRLWRVEGKMRADGSVSLKVDMGNDRKLKLVGQQSSDGSLSGQVTGPKEGDSGTWLAAGSDTPPPPPPPMGDPVAGAAKYTPSCAGCHGPAPANNLNVQKASSVAALNAAIQKVGSMSYLATQLSEQDKLDITAYIASLP